MEKIQETLKYIKNKTKYRPKISVILGSGLNKIEDSLNEKIEIDYKDIPNFPISTVEGHDGKFVFGKIEGIEVLIMKGRFHYYEGYTMKEVVYPIMCMKQFGIEKLIVTNAAGGINENFEVGDFMIINDHINLFGDNPLIGKNDNNLGVRFPDMTEAYNPKMIEIAKKTAKEIGFKHKEGVYLGVSGPCYETKAEIKFFKIIGADAVGMSTVPEVITANYLNMQVLGISFISNMATGISKEKHSHESVIKKADENIKKLENWIKSLIKEI